MKKKSLLFLLLMTLFAPLAANAQETITVCDGGNTNSNVPIYSLFADYGTRSQFIIPAALLTQMDGGEIQNITFYNSTASINFDQIFAVYMLEVDYTTYSSTTFVEWNSMNTVYEGTLTVSGNQMSIDLSNPYTYEGGNLMIGIQVTSWGTVCPSSNWQGENQTGNTALCQYATYSHEWTNSVTAKSFIPKTTFTYTPGEAPACPKPTNLTVSNITSSTADITWVSTAPYFNFEFKKSADETWTPIETTNLFYNAAGLEPNTTYYVRVKAICSVDPLDESTYATTQFTTACGVITSFPWTEDFEGYASGNFTDPCWVNEHISGSGTNIFKVYTSANGTNSTHQLQLPDQSDGTLTKLVLPEMTLPGDNYEFVIDVYRNSSYSSKTGEGIRVYVSTNGEIEGATELAFIPRVNSVESGIIPAEDAAGWYTYELPIGISGTCYIILRGENQYGTSTYIDNFKVKRIPSCLPPTGLNITGLTAHRVDIEWDAEEGVMFQEILEGSFDLNTPPTNWNIDPDYEHTAYWEDLEPNTSYGIWVRKYCSEDDQSEPIYITFTTPEACPAPTGLHVVENSITSTGASFTWDAEEGATFEYFTISDPWEGFEPSVDQSWTSTQNNTVGWSNAFSPNEVVRFYLRKDCGDDGYSDYIFVEFRTLCGPTSLINGYAEDFNDDTYTSVATSTTAPSGYPDVSLPYCWQFLNRSESTGTYPQAFLTSYSTYAVSGNCLFFKSSSSTPLYAILPEFEEDIKEYQLTFTYRNEEVSDYNGTLYVGYMTDPSDASTFVQTLECQQTTTKTEKTVYFANAPQGSFMAFKYEGGTSSNYYLSIDDVAVSQGPACFPTGTLDCIEVSSSTATLSWTLIDSQQSAWVVEYSKSPQFFDPVVSVDANQNWNFVVEDLDPETKYYARVRANCGNDSYGDYGNVVTFTTLESCPVPTGLVVSELSAYRAVISWDAEEDVMFQVLMPGGQPTYPFDPTTPPTNWNVQPQTENFAVWTNLTPETTYGVWMRKYCGADDQSDPIYIMFTTLDACPVPTNLAATNLTQNTADLSWEASEDVTSYTVKYRRTAQVVGIPEQFSTSSTPSDWEVKTGLLESILNEGGSLTESAFPYWSFGAGNGVFDSHAKLNIYGMSCKSWLITPPHTVEGGDAIAFDLALTAWSGTLGEPATTGTDDRFVVLITDDNCETWDILREWNNSGSEYVYNDITCSATGEKVTIPMGNAYMGRTVRFAFYGESTVSNADNNLHIDNVVIGTSYAAGGWSESQNATTSAQLAGLEANMEYEVIVKSDCSDPEEYSEPITFKTLDESKKVFIGGYITDNDPEGNQWKNPYNWSPYGMPSATNDNPDKDIILRHDAVISGQNTVVFAFANSITFEGTPKPTLTIEDGNELWLNTKIDQPDVVTVKKNITGYTLGSKDHYYLISSPAEWAGLYNPANGIVTTESDYDLYAFDPAEEFEWRNYKADPTNFKMDWGSGYLYANAADVVISVTGPVMDNKQPDSFFNYNYYENEEYSFNGWMLCGNTFTCNAYLSTDSQTMAFYRMNAEGTDYEVATGAIKPMEGFFIQGTVRGESVVLSRTAPTKNMSCLNLVLSQGRATKDNAIIRFDEGNTLEKLSFRENSSKVYMPVEGKDYAVATAESMGEMPVSFKAETNGTYTLSFNAEDVTFAYLHLIDNLTGVETDLLATPSYTFEAKTTDYVSRFKLVFATGNNGSDDNFAFFSNGSFVINNEGNATLQVVDVTGRIIKSESINGCANVNVNAAPGVYMLRLVNGENVKVQKVVVR